MVSVLCSARLLLTQKRRAPATSMVDGLAFELSSVLSGVAVATLLNLCLRRGYLNFATPHGHLAGRAVDKPPPINQGICEGRQSLAPRYRR